MKKRTLANSLPLLAGILCIFINLSNGAEMSHLTLIICSRNPHLPYCKALVQAVLKEEFQEFIEPKLVDATNHTLEEEETEGEDNISELRYLICLRNPDLAYCRGIVGLNDTQLGSNDTDEVRPTTTLPTETTTEPTEYSPVRYLICLRQPTLPYCAELIESVSQRQLEEAELNETLIPDTVAVSTPTPGVTSTSTTVATRTETEQATTAARTETVTPTTTISPAEADISDYCKRYAEHFLYYCTGGKQHPEELNEQLGRLCPFYRTNCRSYVVASSSRDRRPLVGQDQRLSVLSNRKVVQQQQERKPIGLAAVENGEQCRWDCERCSLECKCRYYREEHLKTCGPTALPFYDAVCLLWRQTCGKFFPESLASVQGTLSGSPSFRTQ